MWWSCPLFFPPSPYTLFGLRHSYSKKFTFLKMMNFFRNYFSFILCGLLTTTVMDEDQVQLSQLPPSRLVLSFWGKILPSPLHISRSIFDLLLWQIVHFSQVGPQSCSIWNSRALPNLNSSTSDFVGSFSFIDELYNAMFVKDLGTPNHFFRNLLIKLSIFSILESSTSYICIGNANFGLKPK